MGKRQSVAHLRVFGARCWAKVPTVHGAQVTGGSKLDTRSVECRLLGYASGSGNYKVQDINTRRVFLSRDVVFEEGRPHRTLTSGGEETTLFDTLEPLPLDNAQDPAIKEPDATPSIIDGTVQCDDLDAAQPNQRVIPPIPAGEPCQSSRITQPSRPGLQSSEYQEREAVSKDGGLDWATNSKLPTALLVTDWADPKDEHEDFLACLAETKASHNIPHSYQHAMATDPERWTIPMIIEMDTLKTKHTWDLVIPPPGANVMDSMWIFDIKWDGEVNRIKDKARLVGKGYMQRFGIDYNETWAAGVGTNDRCCCSKTRPKALETRLCGSILKQYN
jgi:hypothetical protein